MLTLNLEEIFSAIDGHPFAASAVAVVAITAICAVAWVVTKRDFKFIHSRKRGDSQSESTVQIQTPELPILRDRNKRGVPKMEKWKG